MCFGRTSLPVRHPVRPLWWPSNQHFFTSNFKDDDEDIDDDDEDIADEDEDIDDDDKVDALKPAFSSPVNVEKDSENNYDGGGDVDFLDDDHD